MSRPAAAVIVLAAALLSACGASATPKSADHSPSPSSSAAPPGAVPYADLPPADQTIPATHVPASPAPAPLGTPACRAGQLKVHRLFAGAAAGTAFAFYRFRLVSGRACALQGTPHIAALQDGQPAALRFSAHGTYGMDGRWRGPVLLDRRHAAQVRLNWPDALWCAPPVDNTAVVITLPSGGTLRAPGLGTFKECGDPQDWAGMTTTVAVARFKPPHLHPAHWMSSWRGVRVTTPWRVVHAIAGSTLDLHVTLVSGGHDTSLAACPDFEFVLGLGGTKPVVEKHQLNCAGVTTVDSDGTPYLPADVPVTFDEQVALPDTSVPKLSWSIHQRGLYLSTGAIVTIW